MADDMVDEWIRPSTYISYDVDFNGGRYALKYLNLNFTYIEEQVRQGFRGYIVIAKSRPQKFQIAGDFGRIKINLSRESDYIYSYDLQLELIKDVINNSELENVKALPYGLLPTKADNVDEYKKRDALIGHLQRRLIQGFEVDAIRAVIGDFTNTEEVQSAEKDIIAHLSKQWHGSFLRDESDDWRNEEEERSTEETIIYKDSLIFSSPVIRQALQKITEGVS